jgi:hypothetical protein
MARATSKRPDSEHVHDLAVAVEQLTEETRLLRMSLDEMRDDVVWATRQVLAAGYQISGTPPPAPHDPLAPDAHLPESQTASHPPTMEHAMDRSLEDAESAPYCCDRPKLKWNGDPDAPGITCENCGYVIAENGSVVIWRDPEDQRRTPRIDDSAPIAQPRQSNLFD